MPVDIEDLLEKGKSVSARGQTRKEECVELFENVGSPMDQKEVAERLGMGGSQANQVLRGLVSDGKFIRARVPRNSDGKYTIHYAKREWFTDEQIAKFESDIEESEGDEEEELVELDE